MQTALKRICLLLIPLFIRHLPNTLSSEPYFILSSKPFTARISIFHAEELCPFQEAVVGVIIFIVSAKGFLKDYFEFLNEVERPCFFNQLKSKAFPDEIDSSLIIFEIVIGILKYPPDKKYPLFLF